MSFFADLFYGPMGVFVATILGLVVGSFLNVVIYRIPLMMDYEEKQYAWEVINGEGTKHPEVPEGKFNLLTPASHCPNCGHKIRAWENIPVISYLIQGKKCKGCKKPISPRYMTVELLTALLSMIVALRFYESSQIFFALIFTWTLVALFFIDAENYLLPDRLTLPLMWLGIFVAIWNKGDGLFVPLFDSVVGAMMGYLSLWTVFWLFKLLTGRDGLGYGDFKLLAALLAWQGAMMLPIILIFATFCGIIYALTIKRLNWGKQIPFGPYLASAGWITFLFGNKIAALLGLVPTI